MKGLFLKDLCEIEDHREEKNLTVTIPINNSFVSTKNAMKEVDSQRNSFSVSLSFWLKKLITFQDYFSTFSEESIKIFLLNIFSLISNAAASAPFPGEIKVVDLNGENGFTLLDDVIGDSTGVSMVSGDFNNDGYTDWVIGSSGASPDGRINSGSISLVWGRKGNWSSFEILSAKRDVVFKGATARSQSGASLAVCDMNGDGISEIIISAPYASEGNRWMAGVIYVVKGHTGVWNSTFDLSKLDGQNGFRIYGINSGDLTGTSIACVGDVSGRGKNNLLIGAFNYQPGGASFLVFGSSHWNNTLELSKLNGKNGCSILGENGGDNAGYAVSSIHVGDQQGFAIGAPGYANGVGAAYIILGGNNFSSSFSLSELTNSWGYKIIGMPWGNSFGSSLAELPDFKGDGKTSIAIGAPASGTASPCYITVWFGNNSFTDSAYYLSQSNNSLIFISENSGDLCGTALSATDDINGDGRTDLIAGSPGIYRSQGAIHVIFGQESFSNQTIFLSQLGNRGIKIEGAQSGDKLGMSVCSFSDFTGDGIPAIAFGAPFANNTGSAYVFFGLAASQIIQNNMEVLQGKALLLTSKNFAAIYANTSLPALIFEIRGLQNGYFARRNQTQTALSWFYQSEIAAEQILFLPDGGRYSPLCEISVLNQFARSAYQPCQINFYAKPKLSCDVLGINQNQTITLTSQNFNATDSRTKMSEILLNVSDVQHGYFTLNGNRMPSSFLMNQSDVMKLHVQFSQDGSRNAPFYFLSAINAKGLIDGPVSCASNFFSLPLFEENTITINQGQSHLLSSKNLNVSDARTVFNDLQFIVTEIRHGNFSNHSHLLSEPVFFTQGDLGKEEIYFQHDGSLYPPSYTVKVSNQRGLTAQSRAAVDFWMIPQFMNKEITIHQGETTGLTAHNLNVTDFKSPVEHLSYRIFDISHSCLKKLPSSACIQEFLQRDINNGLLQLTHDGTSNSPVLSLIASNNHTKTLPVKVNIQFALNSSATFLEWFISVLASLVVLSLIFIVGKIIRDRRSGYTSIPAQQEHIATNDDAFKKSNNVNIFSRERLGFFSNCFRPKNDEAELKTQRLNASYRGYGTL